MKKWRLIGGFLLMWVLLIMHISSNLMNSVETSSQVERKLRKAKASLDLLHAQNVELQKLASELRELEGTGDQKEIIQKLHDRLQKATNELEKLTGKHWLGDSLNLNSHHNPIHEAGPSLEREKARRKVENSATELWYYINAKMKELASTCGTGVWNSNMVKNIQNELHGYQTVMVADFQALREADRDDDWRLKESLSLGSMVQRRLEYLQNPEDCSQASLVLCNLEKGCGFGCQLHHVTYCLVMAYAMQRTLILESKGWHYASKGWDSVFLPLSNTCNNATGSALNWGDSNQMNSARVIKLPIIDNLYPRPDFIPLAIPEDLASRLITFHGDAPVWWIGQMVRYLMRPNKQLQEEITSATRKMGFKRPIVGVHIRRTDKLDKEAAYHNLTEYMQHVEAYYKQREKRETIGKRRVYLATDDATVLGDARKRYPDYEFISDNGISQSASLRSRYTDMSLRGIILDINFLSSTDYLVCTFSSQVCRVAYELMQTKHGDASTFFRSLDDVFYYGGQNAHNLRAVESHKGTGNDELSFQVGDLIKIAGNHWNGYSKGTHRKSGRSGMFPSYKVVSDIVTVKMPTYPEVKETNGDDD